MEVGMSSIMHRILAIVAVLTLGLFVMSQSGGQEPFKVQRGEKDKTLVTIPNAVGAPSVQWEYKVMIQNVFDEQMANTWGTEGWELVTIYRQSDPEIRAVFKRPKQMKLEK
jgi:hypothetical protein